MCTLLVCMGIAIAGEARRSDRANCVSRHLRAGDGRYAVCLYVFILSELLGDGTWRPVFRTIPVARDGMTFWPFCVYCCGHCGRHEP